MNNDVLFCLKETVQTQNSQVALNDICSIYGVDIQLGAHVRFDTSGPAAEITALDIARALKTQMPMCRPVNMGPPKCTVFRLQRRAGRMIRLLKTLFLCAVMFFGGAVAIMTFHEDVSMRAVHSHIYEFFTGIKAEIVPAVSIPYSIGIGIGLVMIFGLLRRKRAKPTVLEMDIHEQEKAMQQYISDKESDSNG